MQDYWTSTYFKIKYLKLGRTTAGVDCWGLVCLVYQDLFGIELQSYTAEDESSASNFSTFLRGLLGNANFYQVDTAAEFDIVFFDMWPRVSHAGIIVNPTTHMLHASSLQGIHIGKISDRRTHIEYFRCKK